MITDYWDTPTFRKRCKQVDKVNDLVEKLNGSMDDMPSSAKMARRLVSLQRYLNGLGLDRKLKDDLHELRVLRESMKEILDRTEKELKRDRKSAIAGGICEIHDIANMAVNHWRDA